MTNSGFEGGWSLPGHVGGKACLGRVRLSPGFRTQSRDISDISDISSTTLNAGHPKRLTLGDGFHKRHSGHRIASVTLMNCRLWRWIHAGRVWRATDCAQWPWAMYTGEKYCIQTDSSNFVTWGQEVGYAIRFEDRWTQSYFITQCYQASKIE